METLIFALFAALALGSSIVVVTHKSPIYSTLSLVLTLLSMAVLFVLLGAPFLGAVQVLVYAGAIVVLFLFVIMLLNVQKEETAHVDRGAQLWTAIVGVIAFLGMFWLAFWRTGLRIGGPAPQPLTQEFVALKGVAAELFSTYLLPFEIVGLLLLVAVIGATVAARRPGAPDTLADEPVYASGDEPRTDPLRSGPDPRRPSVAEPAYKPTPKEANV
jgi:NADH-quinone oxidoreductase subunit J